MNVFKKSVAALAAIAGSMVTGNIYAAGPVYGSPTQGVIAPAKATPVTYRKVCTPTGCYYVQVTPPNTPAPTAYQKVCTPTGCYLVPVKRAQSSPAPSVAAPVKNYGTLFSKTSPTSKPGASAPSNATSNDSPFYSQDFEELPAPQAEPVKPAPKKNVVAKPVVKSNQPLPSPFYP